MPRALTVTAIIAAYNEEDVIGAVLADLVGQGVSVYLLDHGSSDGTVAEAERFLGRGLVKIERLAPGEFSLGQIIRRKETLAAELASDWFVNADADEFRESPWPGVGFVEALGEVERLGFNAVDFAVLNFPPVDDRFKKGDDPREAFRFYEPGAHFDRLQVRCWKKQPGRLDLVSTAGHEARFPDRRVFPLRFLLRHYPIRGQAHGERKVFRERLPRFAADERARGWHVQYDGLHEGASFLRESSSLTPYDPWAARLEVALRHRGVEALEAQLASAVEDRDRVQVELAAERKELAFARNELAGAHGEVVARGAELSGVRGELAARGDALTSARELAAVLERELGAARNARLELERQREGAGRERDELLRERHALREAVEALRREKDMQEQEAGRLRLELSGAKSGLRERDADQIRLRHELASTVEASERRLATLGRRLDELLSSRIWRWTAPLRSLLDALRR